MFSFSKFPTTTRIFSFIFRSLSGLDLLVVSCLTIDECVQYDFNRESIQRLGDSRFKNDFGFWPRDLKIDEN